MFSHEHKNPPERYVNASILRQGCVEAAAEVLAKVDLRVDPCEDFYQFACGKISSRTIPADKVDIYPASRHESPEYVSCLVKGGTMD